MPVRRRGQSRHTRHKTRHVHKRPTATPTATPALSLQTEDSISPVTCHGPGKPLAARPFLLSPYHGWTSIVSYFDHDLPTFAQDGLVVTATGLQAAPDRRHVATDFPAYWSPEVRQFLYYDGHNGYDFDLSYRPVYAAAAGKVIFSAYEYPDAPNHGYGQMIMIDHGNGYVTLYGHFSKLLVKKGRRVKAGQEIGISGNTGHSTGPHLHFTVFHNCSPTDPYGWSGSGPDPLQNYQGQVSEYLWKQTPLVLNPAPAWPGLSALPPAPGTRLVLLRLPSIHGGVFAFTRSLQKELETARRDLDASGVTLDPFAGALVVGGMISATRLYQLPDVASIGAKDVGGDARQDVLGTLAQAALITPHRRLWLDPNNHWNGFLLTWDGHEFLLGRGSRKKKAQLDLPTGDKTLLRRGVITDALNGAYAVDLGKLTAREVTAMVRHLTQRDASRPTSPSAGGRPLPRRQLAPPHRADRHSDPIGRPLLFIGLAFLVALAAAWFGLVRRRTVA